MRNKTLFSLAIAAVFMMSMCGCEKKEDFSITVRNITGVPISELEIAPENDNENMNNRLTENLQTDSEIVINFGKYTEEDISDGFQLIAVNADDGSTSDPFSHIMMQSGDTLTLYIDDLGLAIAVNTSDEEVQEMIDSLHEDNITTTDGE